MPAATEDQTPVQDPAQPKASKRGRTRIPPKTLPADFDFGDGKPTVNASAGAGGPPKTLPANFDFDTGTTTTTAADTTQTAQPIPLARVGLGGRAIYMPGGGAPPSTGPDDFDRKESAVIKWLGAKRDALESGSKTPIPDLPPDLQQFAQKAGFPEFSTGRYIHREPGGIVERNVRRVERAGRITGGELGEAFANPATEAEIHDLEKTNPKTAQALKNVGAVGKSFGRTVGGLVTDPTNIALGAGVGFLPKLGQRLASLGFSALATQSVYEHAGQLGAIWDRSDIPEEEKVEQATDMILNTAMATAAGSHKPRANAAQAEIESHMLSEVDRLGPAAADKISKRIKDKLQVGFQRQVGVGPRMAEKMAETATEKVQTGNEAELARHAEAQAKRTEQGKQWVKETHEARESAREKAKVEGRKEALAKQQKGYANLIRENVKSAHTKARSALDTRWGQLREKVGTEHPVSPQGIYDAVEKSRAMLAGVPSDLKIFNDIFKEITEPNTSHETAEGTKPAAREYIPFDSARTQYSAVGEKAYAAEGNLRRALFNVYNAYDEALAKTATDAGAGKQYSALKSDWSKYMHDWHDMSSESTGGSPLARVYRAVDNPVVTAHAMSKFGDRLIETLGRYDKYGAKPDLVSKLRSSVKESAALPKVKVLKAPEKPSPLAAPKLSAQPTLAELTDMVKKAKVAKAKDYIEGKRWHAYDAIMATWFAFDIPHIISGDMSHAAAHAALWVGGHMGWNAFVRSPIGFEWMTKVTTADIKVMSDVLANYPAERAEAAKAITGAMEDTARNGGPAPNIAKFSGLISPAQTREVIKTAEAAKSGNAPVTQSPDSLTPADMDQARKNLGVNPGSWDPRLLAEAEKLRDARMSKDYVETAKEVNDDLPPTERRKLDNANLRRNFDSMTEEEKRDAFNKLIDLHEQLQGEIRTSEKTGLPNFKSFTEDSESAAMRKSHPVVGYADIDDFKAYNTVLDHEGVDKIVLPGVGEIFREAAAEEPEGSVKVYHRSGDEFNFRATDPEVISRIINKVNEKLANTAFTYQTPDGKLLEKKGTGLSHGSGSSHFEAERAAEKVKQQRKAAGLRTGTRDVQEVDTRGAAGEQTH